MCIRKLFIVSKSLDADQKPNHLHNSFLMINDLDIWCNLSFYYVRIYTATNIQQVLFVTSFLQYYVGLLNCLLDIKQIYDDTPTNRCECKYGIVEVVN